MKKVLLVNTLLLLFLGAFGQTNNPYKEKTINLVDNRIVKEFKRFEFLESVASGKDGSIYTTNLMLGLVYQIKNGKTSILVDFEGQLAGLTFLDESHLLVTGTSDKKEAIVLQINLNIKESKILATVPKGILLNGITQLNKTNFLIADSFKGVIWKLNIKDSSVKLWLKHDLLSSPSIEKQSPGVNGIKVQGNSVYVSNTGKMLMLKIPIIKGDKAGDPEIFHKNVFIDDFEMDSKSNVYAATHVYDNIIKITPKGEVSIIATAKQGVAGSTCLAWKKKTKNTLLVSSNGGILKANKDEVVSAKVVELNLE
ncbi:SMP-30/gluconolactonase/LRE family protein [Marinifilum sp. RC60d5]|uniref:SMP-30/gluconolactonase/LRE family protein n=1 Tax=Marinifilum sp. RC60d5 TaxID=3458414 RepID=UPI004035C1CA